MREYTHNVYPLRMQHQVRRHHSTDQCRLLIHNEHVPRGMFVNQGNMPSHVSIPAEGYLTRYNTTGLLSPLFCTTEYAVVSSRPSHALVNRYTFFNEANFGELNP